MNGYALALAADELRAEVLYRDLKGNQHTSMRLEALMHAFNHATDHRGQLITMMRESGLEEVPGTDLIQYQRSRR